MTAIIKYDAACRALAEEASACMTKQEFITAARAMFDPGERKPCVVCRQYAGLTHAHHLIPLETQADRGRTVVNQGFVWLCPNHHAAVHVAIRADRAGCGWGRLVDLTTGERARVFALADMAKDEALAA